MMLLVRKTFISVMFVESNGSQETKVSCLAFAFGKEVPQLIAGPEPLRGKSKN